MIEIKSAAGVAIPLIIGLVIVIVMSYAQEIGGLLSKDDRVARLLAECELVYTRPLSDHFMIESPPIGYEYGRFKCGESVMTGAMILKNR